MTVTDTISAPDITLATTTPTTHTATDAAAVARTDDQTLRQVLDAGTPPGRRPPSVVLSYGLGVDSTAILLRWLDDPTSRNFDLEDLVVVTAMTGDEWAQTGIDVTTHLLPLLAEHRIRFVQVARTRRHTTVTGDGVVVLSDTTTPTTLHLDGAYKLSDEMLEAGTIPQTGGMRACSVHSKGDCLDPVIAHLTAGRPYTHVIGFEANEGRRAAKDTRYNTDLRTGSYPLIEWGWDRETCEAYIESVTGVTWSKSACSFCPFSMTSRSGLARTLRRYAENPAAGAATLAMEHTALALNPTQGLIAGKRAIDAVTAAGLDPVLDAHQERLDATPHAVYEVRRILRGRRDDPTKLANASRSVRTLSTHTRQEAEMALAEIAHAHQLPVSVDDDHIARVWVRRRAATFPTVEHFYVSAPVGVLDKQDSNFESWWSTATATPPSRPGS